VTFEVCKTFEVDVNAPSGIYSPDGFFISPAAKRIYRSLRIDRLAAIFSLQKGELFAIFQESIRKSAGLAIDGMNESGIAFFNQKIA
jgi:hypothetical protein